MAAGRRPAELIAEEELFRAHVVAALGAHARIKPDGEGWPMVPGRAGRLEWRGAEAESGEHRLYAYTDHVKLIAKLRRIPGCHPKQVGDTEAAFWLPADDVEAIRAVAGLLGLRRRRESGTGRSAEELALMRARIGRAGHHA